MAFRSAEKKAYSCLGPPNVVLWYVMVQAKGCGKAFSSVVETAVFRLRAQGQDTRTRGQRMMTEACK